MDVRRAYDIELGVDWKLRVYDDKTIALIPGDVDKTVWFNCRVENLIKALQEARIVLATDVVGEFDLFEGRPKP